MTEGEYLKKFATQARLDMSATAERDGLSYGRKGGMRSGAGSKSCPKVAERRAKYLKMYESGMSSVQIGRQFGVSDSSVRSDILYARRAAMKQ